MTEQRCKPYSIRSSQIKHRTFFSNIRSTKHSKSVCHNNFKFQWWPLSWVSFPGPKFTDDLRTIL